LKAFLAYRAVLVRFAFSLFLDLNLFSFFPILFKALWSLRDWLLDSAWAVAYWVSLTVGASPTPSIPPAARGRGRGRGFLDD